ncbi:Cdc6/Cdc18 family protein [Natronorubrum texcoconense]|uniref:Orc1/cdc6 family replication initiation protein n=1 Tax=Natronorubrum texcoconense TaxID=1095776 RepID=A0A1G9H673_9EURY|nr:Cdc6/Cdc18 family protein [Natronorubrum texcoconense]SDL08498.1 orc1/cdc6 family replication initiation protein [Natronorubrum texcoconense]
MIVEKTVLEADSQPQEILHRHDQISYLSDILEPVAAGDRVDGALIYGPTGTGKTATSRFLCDRLEQESEAVETAYVDCWGNSNRTAILHRILEGVGLSPSGLHRKTPTDELSQTLKRELESPLVVILDEADQIEDQAVLYELYENPQVTMLLIANDDEEFFARLEQRVDSRLVTVPRIHFRKYHDTELVSILDDRADAGLEPESVQRDELAVIADAAAGDARVAIGILRNAAEHARRDGASQIDSGIIESVTHATKREVRRKTISSLNSHQRVLLEILIENGTLGMGELYPRYCDRVAEPKGKRMVRNDLGKMSHYNLVDREGETRSREYSPDETLVDDHATEDVPVLGSVPK